MPQLTCRFITYRSEIMRFTLPADIRLYLLVQN